MTQTQTQTTLDVDVSARLLAKLKQRQVNRILHAFPSPRYWTKPQVAVPEVMQRQSSRDDSQGTVCELYAALPFCIPTDPDRCGYCLFPVEHFKGYKQLPEYLDYFRREGELYKRYHERRAPDRVYIGGGTPNLLKAEDYAVLLSTIRDNFPAMPKDVPITLEGLPQLFTLEKMRALKACGVSRISMGAQQINARLSALSGRKQTPEHVFQAVEWARAEGLECNVDLIFGWPQQTLQSMTEDLTQLVQTGVGHITHYELNVGGATDFALNRRHELPSPEQTKEMYLSGRELLLAAGYEQLTSYDFQKREGAQSFVYEECRRDFDRREVWGWGYAAISDLPYSAELGGWTFMNQRNLAAYYQAVGRGEIPVEVGYERSAVDLRLSLLFRNIQALSVDRADYRAMFGTDVVDEHASVWQSLAELGLVEIEPNTLRLTAEGGYYVPLIQTLLAQSRVDELVNLRYEHKKEHGRLALKMVAP